MKFWQVFDIILLRAHFDIAKKNRNTCRTDQLPNNKVLHKVFRVWVILWRSPFSCYWSITQRLNTFHNSLFSGCMNQCLQHLCIINIYPPLYHDEARNTLKFPLSWLLLVMFYNFVSSVIYSNWAFLQQKKCELNDKIFWWRTIWIIAAKSGSCEPWGNTKFGYRILVASPWSLFAWFVWLPDFVYHGVLRLRCFSCLITTLTTNEWSSRSR